MRPPEGDFIIRGLTCEGRRFRPSDWAERLCGIMSHFGGGRMSYSPHVYPITSDGVKCVMVEHELAGVEPMAYKFLVGFARDNELQVSEVCAFHPGVEEPRQAKPVAGGPARAESALGSQRPVTQDA